MKYFKLHCNITQQVRGSGMKTKHTLVDYMVKFCDIRTNLQIFNEGSMVGVSVATASRIHPTSLHSIVGNGGTKTASFMYPHKKKSSGVRSGERDGQERGPPLPVHFPGNFPCKRLRPLLRKWESASSCWNSISLGPSCCNIGIRNTSNMSKETQSQCVRKKREPRHLFG
jgi:hypothetical protein